MATTCSELEALSVSQRLELKELQSSLADCQRQIKTLANDNGSQGDLLTLYQQEKQRADRLQDFVNLIKS